ncbi:MAG: NAD(+)--dinitrogen-reductase ADP-D-ribosyltransferase [Methylocystaceae bacterium]|nr:NAD(+)--dinitrogen-reductase ADP-D-ribosyltransferase [Methylocystaceae bacterium]
MVKNTKHDILSAPLPKWAKLPINRCNIPSETLGSLGFQAHPRPLHLDGVHSLHKDLFTKLDVYPDPEDRQQQFIDYMNVHFAANDPARKQTKRHKASYQSLLRGWFFDSDSREAAVLKGWVESRFGLSPNFHRGRLNDKSSALYANFMQMRADGLYATYALEAQMDLLYSYCQYELSKLRIPITLYRGVNRLEEFTILHKQDKRAVVLFNNLNSFSSDKETAGAFGDIIIKVRVPKEKILCFPALLDQKFTSENEFMVIGGLYDVTLSYY